MGNLGSAFNRAGPLTIGCLALILITLTIGTAQATSTEITGETTITSPGHYHLNQSFLDQNVTNSSFIRIKTSNVTFDGRGHTLSSTSSASPPTGIYVYSGIPNPKLRNITITNVTLKNWDEGIHLKYTENSTIASTNISSSDNEGIRLELSENVTVRGNTLTSNKQGILLDETNSTTITNNTATNNDAGIQMSYSNNNTISNNSATSSGLASIFFINPSHYNKIQNNHFNSSYIGIYIRSSNANNVTNNNATSCQKSFYLRSSNGTIIEDNEFEGTDSVNHIEDSERTTLKNNTLGKGLLLEGSALPDWNTHTITNNTADGGVIDYRKNLTGADISTATGQLILANVSNSTIHDFNVSGAYNGIVLGFSENNTLQNLTATSNEADGIQFVDSPNNTIANVTATSNDADGISIIRSVRTTIIDSSTSNGSIGMDIRDSPNTTITNCTTTNSSTFGFYLSGSPNATVTNCSAALSGTAFVSSGFRFEQSPNTVFVNSTANNASSGFSLSSSQNVSFTSCRTTSSDTGFDIHSSPDVTIIGSNASGNTHDIDIDSGEATLSNNTLETGIRLSGGTLANWTTHTITNNTINGKQIHYLKNQSGITIPADFGQLIIANITDTVIRNLTVSNLSAGISLGFSDNNTIRNITATSNYYGIYLSHSDNNTIENSTTEDNTDGVYFTSSNNNTIRNVTTISNGDGMYLSGSGNILTGNTLKSNTNTGLSVSPDDNLVYNNLFKNSDNVEVHLTVSGSDLVWNVSKRSGTNIIGGPYIAGNYWASPDGSGFSQTASDSNGDGIAEAPYTVSDLPYTPGETSIDYLPLKKPTTTEDGSEDQEDTDDGWDGPPAPDIQQDQYEITEFTTVREGETITVDTSDEETPVTSLELKVERTIFDPSFKLAAHDTAPDGTERPDGEIYRYLTMTSSLEGDDMETVGIRFRIPNEWFQQQNVDPEKTSLAIKESNGWRKLETNVISHDSESVQLKASAPHLSTFAIMGDAPNRRPTPTPLRTLVDNPKDTKAETHQSNKTPAPRPTKKAPGISAPLAILSIAAALARRRI